MLISGPKADPAQNLRINEIKKQMDIVKFKITPKTIKIEVRNSNNYIFDFNTAVDIDKVDRDVLLKLHNALVLLFKKDNIPEIKSHISPNQTNILEQIEEVEDLKEDVN